jgi:hypothetical protein
LFLAALSAPQWAEQRRQDGGLRQQGMAMTDGDGLHQLLQWLEEELARNRLLVEAFASGKLEIHSWQDGQGMVDTTDDNLAQAKLRVARLKEILATYSREG